MIDVNAKFSPAKNKNKRSVGQFEKSHDCGCNGNGSGLRVINLGNSGPKAETLNIKTIWSGTMNNQAACGTDHDGGENNGWIIDTISYNCDWAISILNSGSSL
jgi:hypothetical protein